MSANQRKTGYAVVKAARIPRIYSVAVKAGCRKFGMRILVVIFVTRNAVALRGGVPGHGEIWVAVARRAVQVQVGSNEVEASRDCYVINYGTYPGIYRVALKAIRRQIGGSMIQHARCACCVVIVFVTRKAVVLIRRIKDRLQVSWIVASRAVK